MGALTPLAGGQGLGSLVVLFVGIFEKNQNFLEFYFVLMEIFALPGTMNLDALASSSLSEVMSSCEALRCKLLF